MNPTLIPRLKRFFETLKNDNYQPRALDFINKTDREVSLNYLRSLPQFQEERFKGEKGNVELVNELSYQLRGEDRIKRGEFFNSIGLREQQTEEFVQILEKPTVTEIPQVQPTEEGGQEAQASEQMSEQPKAGGEKSPGMPFSAGARPATTTRRPRSTIIRKEEAPTEESKTLYVADKGGHVVEERSITSAGTTIKNPETPSSIAIANQSGMVVGKKTLGEETIKPTQSKLVIANKTGVVNESLGGEKILTIADKSGRVVGEKVIKPLESKANIGLKKGFSSVGSGLGEMAKGLGRGIIGPGVTSAYNMGGKLLGGGLNFGFNLSNEIGKGGLRLKGPPKKLWFSLLGIIFLVGILGLSGSSTLPPSGGGNVGIGSSTPTGLTTPTLTSALVWDQNIVNSLNTGLYGYYNVLPENFTNGSYSTGTWAGTDTNTLYWCTYSVIDSYNLAGISGLSKSADAAVITMRQFWQGSQAAALGYKYLDYPSNNNLLGSALPGYVIFMEKTLGIPTGFEHVAMLKQISVDARGNGFIITNDSNNASVTNQYPVAEWSIKNTPYPVRGIGGI